MNKEIKEMSFNKRIQLVKIETFEAVQSEQLDKAGNSRSGYYSIKTIISNLNPILLKYEIDIDVVVNNETASVIWFDCLSDKSRIVPVDLQRIKDIERLAAMQNIVQSNGAVLTYYRRYALTNALNLNATDLIENNTGKETYNKNKINVKKPAPTQTQTQTQVQAQTTPTTQSNDIKVDPEKNVTEPQVKRLFAIANKAKVTKPDIEKWIFKKYNLHSVKDLNQTQYNELVYALEHPNEGQTKQ